MDSPISDYFVYGNFNTDLWSGSYGVDGYTGKDGIDRIIFYTNDYSNSKSVAYIYKVTIPESSDPNTHPNNPEAPGPIAPRTFTFDKSFDLTDLMEANPSHQCEFYVDEKNDIIYFGASIGIRKYIFDHASNNYVFDSIIAPPSPTSDDGYSTQSLAYDPVGDIWYAGAIAWNYQPGITLRKVWNYKGSQGITGTWELAFEYTTTESTSSGTHHDGMEFLNGYLYLADYTGDYIKKYSVTGTLIDVYWHEALNHELEGMGFGALGHFWCGSHGETITEFGGGALKALKGRMTGGGSVMSKEIGRVTHGFTLSSEINSRYNNLEVNWDKGNKFHLTELDTIYCSNNLNIAPPKPKASFNTITGRGKGVYNGMTGATVTFTFTDSGEPGIKDTARIIIVDADGNMVLRVSGRLDKGNHRAHDDL